MPAYQGRHFFMLIFSIVFGTLQKALIGKLRMAEFSAALLSGHNHSLKVFRQQIMICQQFSIKNNTKYPIR